MYIRRGNIMCKPFMLPSMFNNVIIFFIIIISLN